MMSLLNNYARLEKVYHLFKIPIQSNYAMAIFGESVRRVPICRPVHTCICTYVRMTMCTYVRTVVCILYVCACIFMMCFRSSVFLEYIDLTKHF